MKKPMEAFVKKDDKELLTVIADAQETLRAERFKDKFSRKANIIRTAKREIARAKTTLSLRHRNPATK